MNFKRCIHLAGNDLNSSTSMYQLPCAVQDTSLKFKYQIYLRGMSRVQFGRFGPLIGSIDEGTSSVRFIVFCARNSEVIAMHQIPLKGIYPQEGHVEQDPMDIISKVYLCIEETMKKLTDLEVSETDIVAVGITNQRETAVAWDSVTGEPLFNAIVWSDIKTQQVVAKLKKKLPNENLNHFKPICGLPLATTFSALKYKWLLEEVPAVQAAAAENRLCFGTIDAWVIYKLTGGKEGGVFVTDCTNASRTMLMNLDSLKWDPDLYTFFEIDPAWLPEIKSSSEIYGYIKSGILKGVPISGCLGDQQAALFGHRCLEAGQSKNTYGTGCFLLCNTGTRKVNSQNGLIATVAFQLGKNELPRYAIEGSIAVAGSAINWLKDNLEILDDAKSTEAIAEAVMESNDVFFVPAFSGLHAPYWQQDARGVIVGITEETKPSHIIRAALEAVCFQTKDVIEAMEKDCGFPLKELLVDGGMTKNNFLMQLQADLIGIPVVRPGNSEMTALGAAIAAGIAEGIKVWNLDATASVHNKVFRPLMSIKERNSRHSRWKDAVQRSIGWNTES